MGYGQVWQNNGKGLYLGVWRRMYFYVIQLNKTKVILKLLAIQQHMKRNVYWIFPDSKIIIMCPKGITARSNKFKQNFKIFI